MKQAKSEKSQIIRLLRQRRLLLAAVKTLIEDLEHVEPDGWMSGHVHSKAYLASLEVIAEVEGTLP